MYPFYYSGVNVASVLILAEAVSGNVAYTGDAQWVEAGLPITVQVTPTGSPNGDMSIQGSIDGNNWTVLKTTENNTVFGISNSLRVYPVTPSVNYIRYTHTTGSTGGSVTVKAIQPNNVQVDVDNLPA